MKDHLYTTTRGYEIKLRPISNFLLDELKMNREIPVCPTYEVTTASGSKQLIELDEESAKNKGRLEEWNDYQEKSKTEQKAYSEKFMKVILLEGTDIQMPEDTEWEERLKFLGLTIPENPFEKKIFYITHELFGAIDDVGDLISEILGLSVTNEEAVKRLKDSFRSAIRSARNRNVPERKRKVENKISDIHDAGSGTLLETETE